MVAESNRSEPLARLDAHNRGGREYTRDEMERDLRSLVEQLETQGRKLAREQARKRHYKDAVQAAYDSLNDPRYLWPHAAAILGAALSLGAESAEVPMSAPEDSSPASEPRLRCRACGELTVPVDLGYNGMGCEECAAVGAGFEPVEKS